MQRATNEYIDYVMVISKTKQQIIEQNLNTK